MDNFEFSQNAAFYRVKEGKDIASIINNYINTKTEAVGDDCYEHHNREDTVIDGMKYSFIAYKLEKRPNCIKEGADFDDRWKEKFFAYLLILEYNSYVVILKRNIDNIRPISSALKPIDYNTLCKVLNDKKTIYKRVGTGEHEADMSHKTYKVENLI